MKRVFVVVPVRDQWPLTRLLLSSVDAQTEQPDDVLVIDNGSTDDTAAGVRELRRSRSWLSRVERAGSIYSLWNHGFARAKRLASGEFYVLITNNDVELHRRSIEFLHVALEGHPDAWCAYPDYDAAWVDEPGPSIRRTSGVFGDGGMSGSCFMLAGHRIPWRPLVTDLTYQWWAGDNHLAECIEQEGGDQLRVVGLPVRHENEGTARHYDLYAQKLADMGAWRTREARGARAILRATDPARQRRA